MTAEAIPRKPSREEKDRIDAQLDDALDKTFPASDPPAMTEPARRVPSTGTRPTPSPPTLPRHR